MIWHDRRWVIIVPCLALTASLGKLSQLCSSVRSSEHPAVLAALALAEPGAVYFSAWVALSVTVNTMSTALIVGKLLYERRQFAKVLAHGHLAKYITATAILVESAVPLTLVGIVSSVTLIQNTNMPLMAVAFSVWFCLSVCPLLTLGHCDLWNAMLTS